MTVTESLEAFHQRPVTLYERHYIVHRTDMIRERIDIPPARAAAVMEALK